MIRTFNEPAAAIALGEIPDIDPAVTRRHNVGADKVIRYVLFHAAHWNAAYNHSRVGKKAARDCLRWHGRTIDACHNAAVDAGLIAEIGKPSKGKVQPLTYPWFEPPTQDAGDVEPTGERAGDPRDVVDIQPTGEPTGERTGEPTGEPTGDPRDEGKGREAKGGRAREKTEPKPVGDVSTPTHNFAIDGCDEHGWNDPGTKCGGCMKAKDAKKAAAEAKRQVTDGERARANPNPGGCSNGYELCDGTQCALCKRGIELAAAEPPEPDNPDPQATPELTAEQIARLSPMLRGAYLASRKKVSA